MARSWKDVRGEASAAGLIDEQAVSTAARSMHEQVRAYRLAEVRRAQHVSQSKVAEAMGVKQPRVSAIENGKLSRTELGTLQAYVESLGGSLRVVADFGDETLTLRD